GRRSTPRLVLEGGTCRRHTPFVSQSLQQVQHLPVPDSAVLVTRHRPDDESAVSVQKQVDATLILCRPMKARVEVPTDEVAGQRPQILGRRTGFDADLSE